MRQAYTFAKATFGDKFVFNSVGKRGEVRKVVFFDMEEDGLYSVILGDLNSTNRIQDFKPTGNNDAKKVLATVADIIEYFFQHKPTVTIFLTGTTRRLTNLYKNLLLQELNESAGYVAEGVTESNVCELINEKKDYQGYFVFRKNG